MRKPPSRGGIGGLARRFRAESRVGFSRNPFAASMRRASRGPPPWADCLRGGRLSRRGQCRQVGCAQSAGPWLVPDASYRSISRLTSRAGGRAGPSAALCRRERRGAGAGRGCRGHCLATSGQRIFGPRIFGLRRELGMRPGWLGRERVSCPRSGRRGPASSAVLFRTAPEAIRALPGCAVAGIGIRVFTAPFRMLFAASGLTASQGYRQPEPSV